MRASSHFLAFLILGTVFMGCKKDDVTPPEPPVANAGNDQNIQLPANSFTLSGSGTTPQGSITNYTWSRVSGPDNPLINNASSATTSVSGFSAGTYVFQLEVTNDAGLSATDQVSITVIAESASAPVANAGADQTVHVPESFFVLSGSATTEKGNITNYNWTQVSGPNTSTINNATSASTSVTGFVAGTYSFQLEVTNSFGLAAKDTVIITVNDKTRLELLTAKTWIYDEYYRETNTGNPVLYYKRGNSGNLINLDPNKVRYNRNGTYTEITETGATLNGTWQFLDNETRVQVVNPAGIFSSTIITLDDQHYDWLDPTTSNGTSGKMIPQ